MIAGIAGVGLMQRRRKKTLGLRLDKAYDFVTLGGRGQLRFPEAAISRVTRCVRGPKESAAASGVIVRGRAWTR
jgi:hypothetical protein